MIYALGEIGDTRATLPLAGLLNQEPLFETSGEKRRSDYTPEQISQQDERMRERICTALIKLEDPRAIAALRVRRTLNEPHVIEALGKLGDQDAVPELLERLNSESFELRLAAAKGLQGTPDRRSIKPLTAALHTELRKEFRHRSHSDWRKIREEIAAALAATGEPEAATILVESLRIAPNQPFAYDDDYAHRLELSERAGRDPRGRAIYKMRLIAVAPLIAELTAPHRPPPIVPNPNNKADPPGSTSWSREVSAWALKSILSDEFDYGDIHYPPAEAALLACLKLNNERGLQFHAANALGQMHSKRAIPELTRIMSAAAAVSANVTDKDMAGEAGNRIDIVFSSPNVPAVQLDAIELAKTAANALSWVGAPEAAESVEPLLSHGVADVRKAAIFAIVSAKHAQAFKLISPLLDDSSVSVRQTAARQLGFIGDTRAVPLLIKLLETEPKRPTVAPRRYGGDRLSGQQLDSRQQTISMAAQSLGMLKAEQAGDALLGLTKVDTDDVRIKATVALVQIGDERGTEALREVVAGDNTTLRERTMTHAARLTMFANNGFCPKLTLPSARVVFRETAETDVSDREQSAAVRALSGVSDDDTIAWLLARTRSEKDSFRKGLIAISSTASSHEHNLRRTI